MSLFLLQHRVLKLKSGSLPSSFPATVIARITFGPEDAFGVQGTLPRTTVQRAKPARLIWNVDEGTSDWQAEFIQEVQASFSVDDLCAQINGNELNLDISTNVKDLIPGAKWHDFLEGSGSDGLLVFMRYPGCYLAPHYFFNHVTLKIPLGRFKYRTFSGSILIIR